MFTETANSACTRVAFRVRFAVFAMVWLATGLLCALLPELSLQGGESEVTERITLGCLAPLHAAFALAFVIVHTSGSPWLASSTRAMTITIICCFLAHAVIMLTQKSKGSFVRSRSVQVVFCAISVAAVVYYWHWDALHMHG